MTSQTTERSPLLPSSSAAARGYFAMRRNHTFEFSEGVRQPLVQHPTAQLDQDQVHGPISWLNPTRAIFDILPTKDTTNVPQKHPVGTPPRTDTLPQDAKVQWRARDNRKGRHVLIVPKGSEKDPNYPDLTASWKGVARGIWRMCTVFAWWDVSWWIGVLFSFGCLIFIASGLCYWLPLVNYDKYYTPGIDTVDGGVLAFVGATLFQIGAVLLIVEACNDNQTGCFGWALVQAFSHDDAEGGSSTNGHVSTRATTECEHHHVHGLHKKHTVELQHPNADRKWEWWPTWHELKTHYFHEIGFLGSFILAIGATIFYLSGILALPGVYNHLPQGVLYGVYWLSYLVGGILFVVAGALYLIEVQPEWWKPEPKLLGWWIGIFNLLGAIGWTLSASFGYCSASWCSYQSDLSLVWASIAYTIGSLLLWYEALDKYPVEMAKA